VTVITNDGGQFGDWIIIIANGFGNEMSRREAPPPLRLKSCNQNRNAKFPFHAVRVCNYSALGQSIPICSSLLAAAAELLKHE